MSRHAIRASAATVRRSGFGVLAAADLAVVVYALFGPALVAALLMARYLVVAVLVAFGVVLTPFLSFGGGGGALLPPWQLDLGSPASLAARVAAAGVSGVGAALSLAQLRRPSRRLRLPALVCSAIGLAGACGGSWLR